MAPSKPTTSTTYSRALLRQRSVGLEQFKLGCSVSSEYCQDPSSTLDISEPCQAVSGNIQDTWLQDYDPEEQSCFFASSPTGWANDELGYEWLTKVFDRETKQKARQGRDWRLLI